jgi:hypothetical protein
MRFAACIFLLLLAPSTGSAKPPTIVTRVDNAVMSLELPGTWSSKENPDGWVYLNTESATEDRFSVMILPSRVTMSKEEALATAGKLMKHLGDAFCKVAESECVLGEERRSDRGESIGVQRVADSKHAGIAAELVIFVSSTRAIVINWTHGRGPQLSLRGRRVLEALKLK